jgi:hypothetical protein
MDVACHVKHFVACTRPNPSRLQLQPLTATVAQALSVLRAFEQVPVLTLHVFSFPCFLGQILQISMHHAFCLAVPHKSFDSPQQPQVQRAGAAVLWQACESIQFIAFGCKLPCHLKQGPCAPDFPPSNSPVFMATVPMAALSFSNTCKQSTRFCEHAVVGPFRVLGV